MLGAPLSAKNLLHVYLCQSPVIYRNYADYQTVPYVRTYTACFVIHGEMKNLGARNQKCHEKYSGLA